MSVQQAVRVLAYGSNLLLPRMLKRASSARVLTVARLPGYALRFHKRGRDGSGKADAFFTGRGEDVVCGVVYEMSGTDKSAVDLAEGLGRDYFQHPVAVPGENEAVVNAWLYTASPSMIDRRLLPFSWYKEMVVVGARAHGLPAQYVALLESVEARADSDTGRVSEASRLLSTTA